MRKLMILAIVMATTLIVAACGGATESNSPEVAPAVETYDTQTDDTARVVVDVTPVTLRGDQWEFQVGFNTHLVDLAFDPTQISVLRCDQGLEFPAVAWEGAGPGGHHRSGVLTFAALDHPTSFVQVIIRDVADVPERAFRWDIPTDAQAPANDPGPQPAGATQNDPPHLELTTSEFYFEDVSMSKGEVSVQIEIANTGGSPLRIEGVEPT